MKDEDKKVQSKIITIDGKKYDADLFSETAMLNYRGVLVAEEKLKQLDNDRSMIETARIAYVHALKENLPPTLDSEDE